jgi:cobalt/nickel transport system ATP-binding protein
MNSVDKVDNVDVVDRNNPGVAGSGLSTRSTLSTASTAPVLRLEDVHYRYHDGTRALAGASLKVARGERVALVGPNGAGKTTLVLALAGFCTPESGVLEMFGTPMTRGSLPEARVRTAFVFQNADDQLFMPTVLEDVMFGPLKAGVPGPEARRRAESALERMEIAGIAGQFPGHLSAGQKRMASLAAVLVQEPELLVLDEPTSFLDPHARRCLIGRLKGLPMAQLVVTHDLEMALDLCSRVVLLSGGRVAADGPPPAVLGDAALMEAHRLEVPHSLKR